MKKKLTALFLAFSVLASTGMVAFAAPATVNTGTKSTTNSIIYVKKPETLYDVTSEATYTVSATAKSGTTVTVYKKGSDSQYHKIFTNAVTVGASGLYSVTVNLTNGTNNFLLYAEGKAIEVQIVKVDITRATQSLNSATKFAFSSANRSSKPLA
jgi:hypothetical protein